ncbi:MAG TPA: hypothetical protein VFA05_10720 [Gaiellaceae bacterium]|nr:hypothetical protein [Gaiellaceae bacterium]
MAEAEILVKEVKALRTRAGNTRFVVVDEGGREYSTFREEIAAALPQLEGKRARIEYHEERRGGYTNVYLDAVEPLDDADAGATEPDEVAWRTAVEAAPYLLSNDEVERKMPAEELFERLQPFKELVARDIEAGGEPE